MILQVACLILYLQIINAQQYSNVSSNSNCNNQCDGSYQFPFNSINQALMSGAKNLILFSGTYIGINNFGLQLINGPYNIKSYQGPSNTIVDCQFQNQRSAFIIQSSSVQINGITIQNCQNTEDEGGALNIYSASVSLVNMNFINNFAKKYGGAIYLQSASYTCYLCNFSNNTVYQNGGAIYALQGSVSITSTIINQNQANITGGGIFINQSQILVTNTQINDNSIEIGSNNQYSTSKIGAQIGCYDSSYTYSNSTFGSADMYCSQCNVVTYLSDGSKVSDECYILSSIEKILHLIPLLIISIVF